MRSVDSRMKKIISVQSLVTIALMSSVMCIIAPVTVYVGPVPFSLCTAIIYLYLCVFGYKRSVACVGIYLILGILGLPIFAGWNAGLGAVVGPTGGFLIGYMALCLVYGVIKRYTAKLREKYTNIIAAFIGTIVLYVFGVVWYVISYGNLYQAFLLCVVPFVPADIIKLYAAVKVGVIIKNKLIKARVI